MSLDATRWAWEQALPPSTKLVLLALAHCVNGKGKVICYPGQARLAEMCGLKERQVRNLLADLTSRGLIEIDSRPGDGHGRLTNIYRLNPAQLALDLDGGNRQPSTACGRGGNRQSEGGQPAMEGGATGNPVPPIGKREREEKGKKRESAGKLRIVTHEPPPPAATPLSLTPGLDWEEIARKLRPDLRDPAGVWSKFTIYHEGHSHAPAEWDKLWKLWLSRERENHKELCPIARRDRPLGAFLTDSKPDDLTAAFEVTHGP